MRERPAAVAGNVDDIRRWLAGQLPSDWFVGEPEIEVDREEVVIVGRLPDVGRREQRAAVDGFRERSRPRRIAIAEDGERLFRRTFSWGAVCGDERRLFTTLSIPVMTRLRQRERQVLDTLIAAGIARSRSDALAWCVRLVARHEETWLGDLRSALREVERLRARGPRSR